MKNYTIQDLERAYDAGIKSVQLNKERDALIEEGTKSCPSVATFESWLFMQSANEINLSNKRGGWIEPNENAG